MGGNTSPGRFQPLLCKSEAASCAIDGGEDRLLLKGCHREQWHKMGNIFYLSPDYRLESMK